MTRAEELVEKLLSNVGWKNRRTQKAFKEAFEETMSCLTKFFEIEKVVSICDIASTQKMMKYDKIKRIIYADTTEYDINNAIKILEEFF